MPEEPDEIQSEPCDCDHEPDEEHKALCLFWRAPLCPRSKNGERMKLPETMTVGDVVKLMDKALTLEGAEQKELVEALLARGPHARANIGYLTGYFSSEKAGGLLRLFDTEHPVFGKHRSTGDEAFKVGVELGKKAAR